MGRAYNLIWSRCAWEKEYVTATRKWWGGGAWWHGRKGGRFSERKKTEEAGAEIKWRI